MDGGKQAWNSWYSPSKEDASQTSLAIGRTAKGGIDQVFICTYPTVLSLPVCTCLLLKAVNLFKGQEMLLYVSEFPLYPPRTDVE